MREIVIEKVLQQKLIAIVRGILGEDCLKLADALYAGGVSLIEVTFDQQKPDTFPETAAAIRGINERFKGAVLAGAGTVTSPALVDLAADAGAAYIISPDANVEVIKHTRKRGLVSIPGALTPTEILLAHNAGADFVKLFPAAELGTGYLKAVKAPISHVRLLVVGGIHENNIREYLDAGAAGAGVGGNLASKALVAANDFQSITNLAKTFIGNIR